MPYSSPAAQIETPSGSMPVLRIEPVQDAQRWVAENRDAIRATATEQGSIMIRGLGLRDGEVSDVLYVALLRYVGCTADAPEVAGVAGDEISLAAAVGPYVMGSVAARASHTPVADPETAMATAMATATAVHCEAAGMLGSRLGMKPAVLTALRHGFERWDGRGHPSGSFLDKLILSVRAGSAWVV